MTIFQHKLKNFVDLNDAFNTLDVDEFFFHRKEIRSEASSRRMQREQDEEEAVRKLKELCAHGGL
ncbi:hypothetical protein GOP47_0001279 [Adiantum capillus-veneris]|uniref:Uncharacterized protein n=1 Tax=Adiantum capillus-veneris TaxID=13818 RepID=A0A9D4ZPY1_ADICA|nr:hypothetical protein GOP47_0001279 [Adiantum capillus-veneris]